MPNNPKVTVANGKSIDTPECARMLAVKDDSQVIGSFLEWLGENGCVIAKYDKRDNLMPDRIDIQNRLAEYFDIDLDKVEKERRAILEALQS